MNPPVIQFSYPFVVFLGDIDSEIYAKTGFGMVQWRRESCVGQLRLPDCSIDAGVPDVDVAAARAAGAKSLIIGSAAVGGGIPDTWVAKLCEAARAGLDIVAGLHIRLSALPGLAAAAAASGARLVDVRVPPPGIPVGTGGKRTGRRLLTVGTDCACGKKYTALALDQELRRRGITSDFRATGQTGIMIAGRGIPLDAVVADGREDHPERLRDGRGGVGDARVRLVDRLHPAERLLEHRAGGEEEGRVAGAALHLEEGTHRPRQARHHVEDRGREVGVLLEGGERGGEALARGACGRCDRARGHGGVSSK